MTGPAARIDNCRSCFAPIIWAMVGPARTKIPLDAEPPTTGGKFFLTWDLATDQTPRAINLPPKQRFGRTDLRNSHLKTCPHGARWRRRRGQEGGPP